MWQLLDEESIKCKGHWWVRLCVFFRCILMVSWRREACIPAVTWWSKAIFVIRGASLSNISPRRELGPRRIFGCGSRRTSFGPWALPNPLGSPCKRLIMEGRGVQSTRRLARIDQPDRNQNRSVMTGPTPLTGRWRVPIFITQPSGSSGGFVLKNPIYSWQNLKKKAKIRWHLGFLASIWPRLAFLYLDLPKSSLRYA